MEDKVAAAGFVLLKDGVAGGVTGEEVWCELDTLGVEVEGFGEAFDEFGFAESWEAFEEYMATGEDAGEDQIDEFLLSEEDLVERCVEGADVLARVTDFRFQGVLHVIASIYP